MYLAILAAVPFLAMILFCVLKKGTHETGLEDTYKGWAIAFGVICTVLLFFSLLATLVSIHNQREGKEEIRRLMDTEIIYAKKADSLTQEFAGYLAEAYPEHEKDIFKTIAPDKIDIYLVKYPNLRSSETILALVQHISKLQTDRYEQQIKLAQVLKDMRFRPKNPWLWNQFIPTMGELGVKDIDVESLEKGGKK